MYKIPRLRPYIIILALSMVAVILAGGCTMAQLKGKRAELQWHSSPDKAKLKADKIAQAYLTLEKSVEVRATPGAVCIIGYNGYALSPKAFGFAQLSPQKIKMRPDTIFDLASLTKMVATTTAIMMLSESGKISLSDPVIKHLPEFGNKGKDKITIKDLLTHASGLPAWKPFFRDHKGKEEFYKAICETELAYPTGTKRIYSDLGFITLGLIVEKVSGQDLNSFTKENIFLPLGMEHTLFNPPERYKKQCAATEVVPWLNQLMWGEVHDENAYAMGGVAGHAGLFSTAHDLAIFCQMLLNGGRYGTAEILKPETVKQFHTLQLDSSISESQGLGWLISNGTIGSSGGLGPGSFGHTGFTGTSIWINPEKQLFAVLLTNAIHPKREYARRGYFRRGFYQAVWDAVSPAPPSALLAPDNDWVKKTLSKMTLEEKAGQILCISTYKKEQKPEELIEEIQPGGLIVFMGEAGEVAERLNRYQELSKYPLLITADFERGVGTYLESSTDLPIAMGLGASNNPVDAYWAGRLMAIEGRAIGVHYNFAPVVDVNNNPKNPIINVRSFGEKPDLVSRLAVAWIQGAQEFGLLCTAKHFPGHGNTHIDSHSSLAKVSGTKKQIHQLELYPFEKAISEGKVTGIMTAHIWLPAYEPKPIPATISKKIMTSLLREKLGFDGLVFTDAMVMGGIAKEIDFEESIVRALEAGCDVILMPGDAARAKQAIIKAVKEGRLAMAAIDGSVERILQAKTQVGLHQTRQVDLSQVPQLVGTDGNFEIAKEIARNTITIVQDKQKLLPLARDQKLAVIELTNQMGRLMIWRDLYQFGQEVKKFNPGTEHIFMADKVEESDKQKALELAKNAAVIILGTYARVVIGRGNVSLNPEQIAFIQELQALGKPIVLISFANPYVINELTSPVNPITTYICAYGNARAVQEATAEALFGQYIPTARLPVTVNDQMPYGSRAKSLVRISPNRGAKI